MYISYSSPSVGLSATRFRPQHLFLILALAFAGFLMLALFAKPASAAICSFQSVGTSDFNTAGNWTCGQVPTSFDDVMVGAGTTTNLSANAIVQSISVSGTINAVSSLLDVTSTATVLSGGTVTSTTGTLKFQSVTSTGSIGSTSGNYFVTTTFQNNGTFNLGSGTATSTGEMRNTGAGVISGGSGILTVVANFTNSSTATFTAGTGTFRLSGTATQSITGVTFYNFTSLKASGTATIVTTNATVGGALTMEGGGTLSSAALNLSVTGASTLVSGTTVTSTSGVLTFTDTASSTGSIGSNSGNISFGSTLQNNGTLSVGTGFTTTTGALTNAASGTIYNNSGKLVLAAAFTNSGTFNSNAGTVLVRGSTANLGGASFYNLTINKTSGQTATMTASSTITNAFSVATGSTLSVNSRTLNVPSATYSNLGTVSISTGEINRPFTSADFTDSSGGAVSGYTEGGSAYVTIQDDDRNLDGTAQDTFTITIDQGNFAVDGDRETLTLTETNINSGIFRNSGAEVEYAVSATPFDGSFQARSSGTLTGTYTDTYDADDTSSLSESFTITTTASTQSTTGGGALSGGGGGSPVYSTPQTVTYVDSSPLVTGPYVVQDVLNSAPTINADKTLVLPTGMSPRCTSGSLIKLANDGNATTHEDEAVYYCGANGKRYAFPNSGTFFSWYNDFSTVTEVSAADLAAVPLGGNVTYRPGKRMVKIQTDPKVYAIMKGGILRWVSSEAVARTLYGNSWNTMVSDVADTFFTNYVMGGPIN